MAWLLDSYAWLEYFGGNEKYAKYVEDEVNFTASVSLTEVVRSLIRKKVPKGQIERCLKFITKKSTILPIGEQEAIRAGFVAEEQGLHFSDALIYSLATPERKVVTGDRHFKGKANAEFVA